MTYRLPAPVHFTWAELEGLRRIVSERLETYEHPDMSTFSKDAASALAKIEKELGK